jgi:hypothetical protein
VNAASLPRFPAAPVKPKALAAGMPPSLARKDARRYGSKAESASAGRGNLSSLLRQAESLFENSKLAAGCRQNQQAGCLRYACSARFQRAGSRSFQLRWFQAGRETADTVQNL